MEYYLRPANDFLEDFAGAEEKICLFTDQPPESFVKAMNICAAVTSPDDLIKDIWNEPNWRFEYRFHVRDQVERRWVPELIAIWLGKLEMMRIAAKQSEMVLWQDSGIRMPRVFKKKVDNYKKKIVEPARYTQFCHQLLEKYPVVFMSCDKFEELYHGVPMSSYSSNKELVRAGFILARASEVEGLYEQVKEKWRLLIQNGHYGTEENALTLCYWDRPDAGLLSYDAWLDGLGLR